MAYRNKTYVCFDGDEDMHYYRLMQAWSENENFDFEFYNAHNLNTARDTSTEENIKKQLMARLNNSKLMIVLIGKKTKFLTKFVKLEMEVALNKDIPIIAVNLNGSRTVDDLCPPTLRGERVVFVSFNEKIITYAMKNWPAGYLSLKTQNITGARIYNDEQYKKLGL